MRYFSCALAACLLWAGSASADPLGSNFTYQGQLTDSGSPASGHYDLQFALFTSASGGAAVDAIQLGNQSVTEGLINASLDFTDAPFTGQALWIEVSLKVAGGNSYTTLSPRQAITATPYALYALSGNPGPAGAQGATGPAGSQGLAGPAGAQGLTGAQGLAGPTGSQGPPGFVTLPYSGSATIGTPALQVQNTGTGPAIAATSTGSGIPGAALTASGTGIGAVITNTSTDTALLLGNNVAGNGGSLLTAFVPAGVFKIDGHGNIASPSSASFGTGVQGTGGAGTGVYGTAAGTSGQSGAAGVWGNSHDYYGVWGTSVAQDGVAGNSTSGDGVGGGSSSGSGVRGDSTNGIGVYGTGFTYGVRGDGNTGVYGTGAGGDGVRGDSTNATGVSGSGHIGGTFTGVVEGVEVSNNSSCIGSGCNATLMLFNSSAGELIVARSGGYVVFRVNGNGTVFANGGYSTGGADVAEYVPSAEVLEPGDVVEIDAEHGGEFRLASTSNSTSVAGVISTQPGLTMNTGESAKEEENHAPRLALIGRVPVKASAENGAIRAGDLLVSSSTPGRAMRAPNNPQPGTVIGKAMQKLDSNAGEIEMLVMLR